MTSKDFRKHMLGAGSALRVLAMVGAGATAAGIAITPAAAQDYTSGSVTGTVTDESGNTVQGATVTLTSADTGASRTSTSSANGGFRFGGVTPGSYNVVVTAADADEFRATDVIVSASQTTALNIGLTTTGNVIIVTGAQIQQDFTGTTTGVNVDLEDLVKTVPISRDLASVILLAPGTSLGDSSFTDSSGNRLASIGGSSVAENAYYLNGLNVTNFDNYLGSVRVPFEFYKSVEVKSGGYSAEYGRATGGIVNAVTKSGSNEFTAAMHLNWEPNFLRSATKDLYTCQQDGTCNAYTNRRDDRTSEYSAIVEAGMPIIKDKLFVYGLAEFRKYESTRVNPNTGLATLDSNNDPFWAVKVDAYPIESQHLELTVFDTRNTTRRTINDYTLSGPGVGTVGAISSTRERNRGGLNFVGKWTGNMADWLTLSAAYGRMRDRFDDVGVDEASNAFYFSNSSGGELYGVANGGLYTSQSTSGRDFPYEIERKFYRADADLFFTAFGDHHIRFGFDKEDNTLDHATVRTGGDLLYSLGFINDTVYRANTGGGAGVALLARAPDANGNIVELNYFNTGGSFTSTNTAFYIQDEWQITDALTLNLGVRRDDFNVKDPSGESFIKLDKNYAPRVGFTFEAFPESQGEFFGSYGWYYLPIASNTAFRAVGSEYYIRERYYFDGIDPATGLPNLTGQVTNNGDYQDTCVFGLNALSTGVNCNQTGDGEPKDATYYLAQNVKPTRESEIILGYRQRVGELAVSLSYTHRQVDNLNEDSSFDEAITAYCEANGIAGCDSFYTTGSHQFAINNVGKDVTLVVDGGPLDGQTITIPAELTGYPKGKRKYDAVDLTIERPWDGKWSLQGSYTWSVSKGNSEGFVQSDIGQDDAGTTIDFDFPGFTDNAYGYLPNHRRHRFKLYGAYEVAEGFVAGMNLVVESPRKLSCFGFNPNNYFANNYGGPYNHYCNGEAAPRGEGGKSDWNKKVDLSFRYNFEVPTGQNMTLRADVFNVFNWRPVQYRYENGDLDAAAYDADSGLPTAYIADPNYGQPRVYQSGRSVRLGMDIAF